MTKKVGLIAGAGVSLLATQMAVGGIFDVTAKGDGIWELQRSELRGSDPSGGVIAVGFVAAGL